MTELLVFHEPFCDRDRMIKVNGIANGSVTFK